MVWDGRQWLSDPRGTRVLGLTKGVASRVRREAKELPEGSKERKAGMKWAKLTQSSGRRKAMVDLVKGEIEGLAQPKDFDANRMLLTVANGTLDLTTGKLGPFKSGDMLTKASDVIFNPAARSELWETYLAEILPDEEVRRFFQTFVGYCLTGSIKERKIVVCYGLGRNGKSVLLRVLHELLGPYAGTIRPDMLLVRSGEPHPTEEAALLGKRLVVTSELRKGKRFDEEKVKALTGGDVRAARRMHEDFWDMKPTAKIIVAANHKPSVADASDSFWDRMVLVPFGVRIADDKVDKDLMEKLFADLPAVLNWAVEGCLRWQAEGLTVPAIIKASSDEYRAAEDKLADFLAENFEFVAFDASRVTNKDVMAKASEWFKANNIYMPSDRTIAERLLEGGAERTRSNGVRYWARLKLKSKKSEQSVG